MEFQLGGIGIKQQMATEQGPVGLVELIQKGHGEGFPGWDHDVAKMWWYEWVPSFTETDGSCKKGLRGSMTQAETWEASSNLFPGGLGGHDEDMKHHSESQGTMEGF